MSLSDFLSPLRRKWMLFLALWSLLTIGITLLLLNLPESQKITFYFSVKPYFQSSATALDPSSSTEKITEMIAGWAKNPAFRAEVLQKAQAPIKNFKRKISARRQNNLNVFWTIKLYGKELAYSDTLIKALEETLIKHIKAFNTQNSHPYAITPITVAKEPNQLPPSWLLVISVVAAGFLSVLLIYLLEQIQGVVSFRSEVTKLFQKVPILTLAAPPNKHDKALLERFILTFNSPRLIGTFPEAEKYFSLAPSDAIDEAIDTPILLVRLGSTPKRELENLYAIFGRKVGIILFEY